MVEPFLGFIREHEKQFAQELGVLRFQLVEARFLVDRCKLELQEHYAHCDLDDKNKIDKVLDEISNSAWVFDNSSMVGVAQDLCK